jgi:hypothetical protein
MHAYYYLGSIETEWMYRTASRPQTIVESQSGKCRCINQLLGSDKVQNKTTVIFILAKVARVFFLFPRRLLFHLLDLWPQRACSLPVCCFMSECCLPFKQVDSSIVSVEFSLRNSSREPVTPMPCMLYYHERAKKFRRFSRCLLSFYRRIRVYVRISQIYYCFSVFSSLGRDTRIIVVVKSL